MLPNRLRLAVGISVLACLGPATAALGQEEAPPTPASPEQPEPAGDEARPGRTAIPGLEDADFRLKTPQLLREGTFVQDRRGTMVKLGNSGGSGPWAFVFLRDAEGRSDRPMVLVPCEKLQRMQQMLADRPGDVVFSISGHVYAYKGINYLEPTSFPMVSTTPAAGGDAGHAGGPPGEAPGADPRVADLIKSLESQREGTRTLEPSRPLPASAAGQPGAGVIPEGKTVVRRRGRMVRGGQGDWMFAMDSGTAGEGAVDRPMALVPCMNLSRMEALAAKTGDSQTFEVSGRVLTYEGRNYLVPTLYQAYAVNDLEPRQ